MIAGHEPRERDPSRCMLALRVVVRASVILLLVGCDADTKGGTKAKGKPISDEPIPCQSDADCPGMACGPCSPGKVVTEREVKVDCKTNPCIDARLVCTEAKVCAVHADAKPKPPR